MSSLKTFAIAGISSLILPTLAAALPEKATDRVQVFATCAGRLSALEESQRLFEGPLSEKTATRRDMFSLLVDATLPDAKDEGLNGRTALHWRVEAKMAQAVLLQQAMFGTDPLRSAQAQTAADQHIATCEQLLLGA
ncbi:hypothetical protein [Actibacterium pelagium]|uniref:Uncharacterized protein n=1 Tax=Actibacterium pelagium TaxID=2029103 RepID=A0A917EIL6_9RHOB|nr:hypothetical protein [Actibacterium pelagium]GGE47182.1 hypothetical protein GCM10011517_13690 [Actibacterium pelagium]